MAKRHPSVVRHSSGALMLVDTSTAPRTTKVAKLIRMCGMRMTALYLKKRDYTLDEALVLILGTHERFNHLAPVTTPAIDEVFTTLQFQRDTQEQLSKRYNLHK